MRCGCPEACLAGPRCGRPELARSGRSTGSLSCAWASSNVLREGTRLWSAPRLAAGEAALPALLRLRLYVALALLWWFGRAVTSVSSTSGLVPCR
jgi:hypothetical protein